MSERPHRQRTAYPYLLVVFLLFALGAYSGCAADPAARRVAEGEELYIQNCSQCHQQDGQGFDHVYPPLAGNPIVTLHDPNPTIEVVLNGRGSMPPFGEELEVEELARIVSYIRWAWGNNASPVSPTQIK